VTLSLSPAIPSKDVRSSESWSPIRPQLAHELLGETGRHSSMALGKGAEDNHWPLTSTRAAKLASPSMAASQLEWTSLLQASKP
jgi:hypothetical protein